MTVLQSMQCARLLLSLQNIARMDPVLMGALMGYRYPVQPGIYESYSGFPLALHEGKLCCGSILHGMTAALTSKALLAGNKDGQFVFALTNFPPQNPTSFDADLDALLRAPQTTKEAEERVARFFHDLSAADPIATDMIMGMSARATPDMARLLGAQDTRPYRVTIEQMVLALVNVTLGAATSTLTVDHNGVMDLVSHYPQSHESASCSA